MSYIDADLQSVQSKVGGLDLTDAETEALARLLDEAINGDVVGFKALCNNETWDGLSTQTQFAAGDASIGIVPGAMAGTLRDLSVAFRMPRQP